MNKRTLSLLIVFTFIALCLPLSSSIVFDDIQAYYKLDELSGTKVIEYAYGNNATKISATQGVNGIINTAYKFDGATNYLNASKAGGRINMTSGPMTINAWINKTSNSGAEWIIGGYANSYAVGGIGGNLYFSKTGVDALDSGFAIPTDAVWRMVTVVYNTTDVIFYVNGTEVSSQNYVGTFTSATDYWVGNNYNNQYWVGEIDEIGIWNSSLTSMDLMVLYNNGLGYPYYNSNVILTSPLDGATILPVATLFNATTNFPNPVVNSTLSIWTAAGALSSEDFVAGPPGWTKSLSAGSYKWNIYVCDTSNTCSWAVANYTLTVSNILEVSQTYDSTVFETSSENFTLTVNYSSQPTNMYLIYDSISHTATKGAGGAGDNVNYTVTMDIPASIGTKSFNWTDGVSFTSTLKTQIVNETIFNICNATNNINYLNITVKDEKTLASINSSVSSATIEYWLGSGTVTKSFLYQNNSQLMSRSFCLSPGYKTLSASVTNYQYSDTNYPQRVYSPGTLTLTNTTLNKILYLLSSTDGIYTTFVVLDSTDGTPKVGASVAASVDIGGVPTIVAQGITDAAGSVTFWLDPTVLHTVAVTQTGCSPQTLAVYPSTSGYTITMDCGGGAAYQSNPLDGVIWQKYPLGGVSTPGNTTFFFNVMVTATNRTIVKTRFELWNGRNNTLIMSNTTLVSSGLPNCNALQCNSTIFYETHPGDFIKAKYFVDVGQGYVLLEADAMWKYITPSPDRGGIMLFFEDLKNLFNEMGTNSSLCAGYGTNVTCNAAADCTWKPDASYDTGGICVLNDELNKQEYSRIVFFFFVMAILMAFANKASGEYDGQNPGMILLIPLVLIVMGSLIGGVSGQGMFYYNLTKFNFINNYILALTAVIMAGGYYAAINRRYSL